MINIFWILLIIVFLAFSFIISKHINFINYNIIKLAKSLKAHSKNGLFLSLGTKIGVGSIIGTTVSIYLGGPGSVFWLMLFSLFSSSLIYYESYIGSKYKERKGEHYVSGPYFFIKKAVNNKYLSVISMIVLIICYSLFFQMIQTNTITQILEINFFSNKFLIAFVFLIIILFLIFFSVKDLISSINKLVPFMCIFYILIGLFCIFKNIGNIGNILEEIITSAFTKRGIFIGLIIGVKRAIFLNEIMIGTSSVSSGIDNTQAKESAALQTIGMYFITFVVSFITCMLVLLFKENNIFYISNYNELISEVFIFHFGQIGPYILIIILFLFAITTIISGYYIGISNLEILFKSKKIILIFKVCVLLFCICGVFLDFDIIWKYIDALMYILILINIYSLYKIYKGEKHDRK